MLLTGILKPPSFTFCRFLHASSQKLSKSLMVPNDHDHYEALEIPPDATLTEIREAFFKKAKAYHPDVNSTPEAKEKFLKIRESYKVLSNGKSRSVYDHQYTVVARPRRYVSDEEQLMIDTKKMIDQEVYLMTKHVCLLNLLMTVVLRNSEPFFYITFSHIKVHQRSGKLLMN